jgi:hypothetical protein
MILKLIVTIFQFGGDDYKKIEFKENFKKFEGFF